VFLCLFVCLSSGKDERSKIRDHEVKGQSYVFALRLSSNQVFSGGEFRFNYKMPRNNSFAKKMVVENTKMSRSMIPNFENKQISPKLVK